MGTIKRMSPKAPHKIQELTDFEGRICGKRHPEAEAYCTADPLHIEEGRGVCNYRPFVLLTPEEQAQVGQ